MNYSHFYNISRTLSNPMKIIKTLLKLQKAILLTFCFFLVTSNVSAYQNVYYLADFSFISSNAVIDFSRPPDSISYIRATPRDATQFCVENGGQYVWFTISDTSSNVAIYDPNNSYWYQPTWTYTFADTITCEESNIWNSSTPSTLTGSMLFMNFNPSSGDYEISEDFLIWLIIRVILWLMFFTLMWKFSSLFWKLWSSISPYIKLWKK